MSRQTVEALSIPIAYGVLIILCESFIFLQLFELRFARVVIHFVGKI